MIVELNIKGGYCKVTRENTDKKYYGVYQARGESNLLHAIKNELNKQGYDFIKKRMWKDGHMMADEQQYLRERKPVNGRVIAIYNGFWQIRGAEEDFNRGEVKLMAKI